ncbi:basic membrane protein A [Maridesulfovibrio ferrireducens]|uniref:Basic membrane protein A n=1 Tax=Maridesulfovibrio ferrireducens TaxID=246191 RepID=A0A1G9KCV8_9BACT|nr:BMP family ABC transporter substrate-binding protein [Maridesulfovibrio ferrireducens]SDL47412.1 basic membrane protein A [Maridesulfovibrio ferrireducens]
MNGARKFCFLLVAFGAIVIFSSVSETCFADSVVIGFITDGSALDDDSFNCMTVVGLRRLQSDYDVKVQVRCGGFTAQSFAKGLNSLLDKEIKIIVINASTHRDLIVAAVKTHSDVIFILNGVAVTGYPNVSSLHFGQRMGSCLVGALCAWQSKTGKIGFIGGNESPVILEFLCGFKQGVKLAGEKVDVDVKFVRKGLSVTGFEDPHHGNELAKAMYASGVDIIYSVAGLSGNGIIYAAQESGNYVVGVDSNQDYMAKGNVLTSMMKLLDVAVYQEVVSVLKRKFTPGVKEYDLLNGGVALTDMKFSRHLISKKIRDELKIMEQDLVSGKIVFDCSGI